MPLFLGMSRVHAGHRGNDVAHAHEGNAMDADMLRRSAGSKVHVHIDEASMQRLRAARDRADIATGLAEVRRLLTASGLAEAPAGRIAIAIARYALYIGPDGNAETALLWRMSTVDEVPLRSLAALTWGQVRPFLRELVLAADRELRYHVLTPFTASLLRQRRRLVRGLPGDAAVAHAPVFPGAHGGFRSVPELAAQVRALHQPRDCVITLGADESCPVQPCSGRADTEETASRCFGRSGSSLMNAE